MIYIRRRLIHLHRLRRKYLSFRRVKELIPGILFKLQENTFEKEIFNSSLMLKNLSYTNRQIPLSADYMIEELMKNSKALNPVYGEMLSLYRSGYDREAFDLLYEKVPLKAAKNFAQILSKIDKINPSELVSYMTSFEKSLSENRITRVLRRTEKKSFAITALSTVCIFAVLLNFVVVVVFSKTMDMIGNIF